MRVSVTRIARAEIDRASQWYEREQEGLGQRFLNRIDEALDKIGLNPLGYAKVIGENRRCNVERFPYAIWFKIAGEAVVVGCLHAKRAPALAKERSRGNIIEMPKPPDP